jgi:hypothetical protein
MIVYHIGTPRIMFLGALKLTTIFVFGFFAVVVIPGYTSADVPLWKPIGREYTVQQNCHPTQPAHLTHPSA